MQWPSSKARLGMDHRLMPIRRQVLLACRWAVSRATTCSIAHAHFRAPVTGESRSLLPPSPLFISLVLPTPTWLQTRDSQHRSSIVACFIAGLIGDSSGHSRLSDARDVKLSFNLIPQRQQACKSHSERWRRRLVVTHLLLYLLLSVARLSFLSLDRLQPHSCSACCFLPRTRDWEGGVAATVTVTFTL
jgi:hypothetical protein